MKRAFASLLIIIACFVGSALAQSAAITQTTQETTPDPSLKLLWTMRNTGGTVVEDSSSAGHNGALIGNAYFKQDPQFANTVQISDSTGYIMADHSADLEPARGTVETWFKADVMRDQDLFVKTTFKMIRSGVEGEKAVYGVHLLANGKLLGFILNDTPSTNGWTMVSTPSGLVKAGEWHLVALRWDGKRVSIFLDGQLYATKGYLELPGIGLSYYGETPFTMGYATFWNNSPNHGFLGSFSETRIYDRALTNEELAARIGRSPIH